MFTFSRIIRSSAESSFHLLENNQVGVIRFSRKETRNAITLQMCDTISYAAQQASSPSSVLKALLITGDSSVFCAGRDLKASLAHSPAQSEEYLSSAIEAVKNLLAVPIPIVVSIEKVCLGLGLEIALAGDIRVCGSTTQFGFPEIGLSLFPGCGGAVMLPALLGNVSLASDWILSGRRVSAQEALKHGLVSRVVDDGSAYNESLAIASQFVEKNRDLLIKTKAVVKHEFNKKVNSEWMQISEKLRREVGQHPAHREALHRFVHRKR